MAILGVDDIKAQLTGGGARPNLFQVTMNFPAGITGRASQLTGADSTKGVILPVVANLSLIHI